MTAYRVVLYRAQRLTFREIEAVWPRQAALLASEKPTSEAARVDDRGGFDHSARVTEEDEIVGDTLVPLRADGGAIDFAPRDTTNALRAAWAGAALDVFRQHSDCEPGEALEQLFCGLMHLALETGVDLPSAAARAGEAFETQLAEEGRHAPHPVASLVPPQRFRQAACDLLTAVEALMPHVTQQLEEQRTAGFPAYSDFERAVATAQGALEGTHGLADRANADKVH